MYFVRKINSAAHLLYFPKSHRDFWWVENFRRVHETFLRNVWCGFIASLPTKCAYGTAKKSIAFSKAIYGLAWQTKYIILKNNLIIDIMIKKNNSVYEHLSFPIHHAVGDELKRGYNSKKTLNLRTQLNESKTIFASKYKLYLPTEKELIKELKAELESLHNKKMN